MIDVTDKIIKRMALLARLLVEEYIEQQKEDTE